MSDDELSRKRKEHEDDEPDVEAHSYVTDESSELDPERKRKRKHMGEADGAEPGRKRK